MFPAPVAVQPLTNHRIRVRFADGVEGVVDLAHLAGKGVFKAWETPGFFEQVTVSTESGTVTWPGELDLCPNVLYHKVTGKPLPGQKPAAA